MNPLSLSLSLFLLATLLFPVLFAHPQRQVVPQQLHDQCAVLVALLVQGVELRDRLVKGLLGQLARTVR